MNYKIIVYVPLENADAVRQAMGEAGGGRLGNYTFCSFSTRGLGRFRPGDGAHPHIGKVGELEAVEEERIEVTCQADVLAEVIAALKRVHPYEEAAYDVYRLSE